MPNPEQLREEARLYRMAAVKETEPHLKRRLASHALALAQMAEKIERKESGWALSQRRSG